MGDDRPGEGAVGRARLARAAAVAALAVLVVTVGVSVVDIDPTIEVVPSGDAAGGGVGPAEPVPTPIVPPTTPASPAGADGTTVPAADRGTTGAATARSNGSEPVAAAPPPVEPAAPFVPWSPEVLYVQPDGPAAQQAVAWESTNPVGAALLARVAQVPQAKWFVNEANGAIQGAVDAYVSAAARAGAMPVLVAYHIPGRDCGGHSAGGAASAADYAVWMANFTAGIGDRPAVVIVEPDALAHLTSCLPSAGQEERLALLKGAVEALKQGPATHVYLDAGTVYSRNASTIASWLVQAGVDRADGFSLNVANFHATELNLTYGRTVSSMVGGKHFVIDTSRNGNGATPDHQWCNPPGRALGAVPEVHPPLGPLVDALLWVKTPGQSDGACNGGPAPGAWWPEYLQGLAQAAGW